MRATAVRRTAIAASVASMALLVTACGGSGSGSKSDDGKGVAKDSAAKPAVKALTAAELEKASLVQGDVKAHKITKAGPADSLEAAAVSVDKQECLPVAHAFYGARQSTAVASTNRKVISERKAGTKGTSVEDLADMSEGEAEDALTAAFDLTSTLVSLSSYEDRAAAENVTGVREAAAKCAGGFTITASGRKQKVTKLTELKVTGGEEALAWTVVTDSDGDPFPFKLAVVREAGTIATFTAFNAAASSGGTADFELPTAVVDAQVAKLG